MGDAYNSTQTASAPHHTSIAIDRAPQRSCYRVALCSSECLLRRSDNVSHRGQPASLTYALNALQLVAETTHNSGDRLAPRATRHQPPQRPAPSSANELQMENIIFNFPQTPPPNSRDPRRLLKEKLISIIKYHSACNPKRSSNYLIGIELTCSAEIIKL